MIQKTISIMTPCYNEEENVLNVYNQVREVMAGIGKYEYEHIFIDNSSHDNTVAILKSIAAQDKNVKIIVNSRNFGHIRSPIHALFQARGDAVIGIVGGSAGPASDDRRHDSRVGERAPTVYWGSSAPARKTR